MEAGRYNLKIKEGADWSITMWLEDDQENIKDLTDYTALMHIRGFTEGSLVKELGTTPKTGITITAAQGRIDIQLTNAETKALAIRQGVYDLFVTDTIADPDKISCILEGDVEVRPAVTR
jgi:hypothetical protein